jgi:ADP-ribosyl-[dinitrogen reductase] hydrolase
MDPTNLLNANQERFTGSLLGMAIGDAMGMPVSGWPAARIQEEFGRLDRYFPKQFVDGAELAAGEFTDDSEIALCIVESFTASNAELDPDVIQARMRFLAEGESRRWMAASTIAALLDDQASPVSVGSDAGFALSVDLAARGIPIGLIHSIGRFSRNRLVEDTALVAGVTHQDRESRRAVELVALAVALAARRAMSLAELPSAVASLTDEDSIRAELEQVATGGANGPSGYRLAVDIDDDPVVSIGLEAIAAVSTTERFEDAVTAAVNRGGFADSRGAVAGAIAGAWYGAGGIPQRLVDELEGRIYLSVAVPWFYRAVQQRAGRVIPLQQVNGDRA